jgi:hypothetical protein
MISNLNDWYVDEVGFEYYPIDGNLSNDVPYLTELFVGHLKLVELKKKKNIIKFSSSSSLIVSIESISVQIILLIQ